MPRTTWAAGAMALGLIALAGCADNPMVLQGRVAQYQQQQSALQKQNELYQARIDTLDRDNQHKEALLAQQQQQTKLLEDRLAVVTEQLRSTTDQLAQVQGDKQEVDSKAKALTASLRRQAGVSITPNNSFLQTLPAIRYPDVHVRRDGDVIRIELPGNQLFDPGSARVRPGGDEHDCRRGHRDPPHLSRPAPGNRRPYRQRSGDGRPIPHEPRAFRRPGPGRL